MSTREVVHYFDADSENDGAWWARAFASQCQTALDEVEFLCPWMTQALSPRL